MKYLKRFNESDEFNPKEYTELHLASLIDIGFTVNAFDRRYSADIIFRKPDNEEFFYWDEVKDYFIPYLTILSEKFHVWDIGFIVAIRNRSSKVGDFSPTVDEVINDKLDEFLYFEKYPIGITCIVIKIK